MREGYQQKSQRCLSVDLKWKKDSLIYRAPYVRFALMDAEITDLTNSGAAEMVVGPVVFENFVLDHPGR